MAELSDDGSVPALALRFLILTDTRTSEALHSRLGEIDPLAAVWSIPAERMKTQRAHRVPLTDATVSILEALPSRGVFPGARPGRPLSSMALLLLLRRMALWGEWRPGRLCAVQLPRLIRGGFELSA